MAWRHFDNWNEVLRAARKVLEGGGGLYYKAPFGTRPHHVRVKRVYKNGKVRLDPEMADTDPFTADRGRFDRFVWLD